MGMCPKGPRFLQELPAACGAGVEQVWALDGDWQGGSHSSVSGVL